MTTRCKRHAAYGELIAKILWLLDEHNTITCADIRKTLGIRVEIVRAILSRLLRNGEKTGKRLYILSWYTEVQGERRYPRAIYARYLGKQHRDAPKPKKLKGDTP
jgi:hypothetical protein